MSVEFANPKTASPARRPLRTIDFQPAGWLSNRHAQTLLPWALGARKFQLPGKPIRREVQLEDGDRLILHDDCPDTWSEGQPVLLLMHGLSGCHQSNYMVRLTSKALARGVRVFRLDHRGSGAGRGLARHTYHAGRSEDVPPVIAELEHVCEGSPISIVGFSLSANLILKLLGERPDSVPESIARVVAVSPPIDLRACVHYIGKSTLGRTYDRNFAKSLVKQVRDSPQWRRDVPLAKHMRPLRRVVEFDELYTAPAAGYDDVDHYYREASAMRLVPDIKTETTILIARDDPMVPFDSFENLPTLPENVNVYATKHGGHLGFYGNGADDPDRYWMDWRILEWLFDDHGSPNQQPSEAGRLRIDGPA